MNRRQITAYKVQAGALARLYATEHHAEQMARALRMAPALAGVAIKVQTVRLPDDALTRIVLGQ